MRKISVCFFILSAFLIGTAATGANEWLPNFEDVPMMEKTTVDAENSLILSKPDGKIVQTAVTSNTVTRRQLQRFYRDALKELGWKNMDDTRHHQTFVRGTDQLKIDIVNSDPLRAQFTLTPRDAGGTVAKDPPIPADTPVRSDSPKNASVPADSVKE